MLGLRRRDAPVVQAAICEISARGAVADALARAAEQQLALEELLRSHLTAQRWIAHDTVQSVLSELPDKEEVLSRLSDAERMAFKETMTSQEGAALGFLGEDHFARVATTNDEILTRELATRRAFFAAVEKSPLTEQQASAVACFDNRVRVIAAAGSGKTSVMVARAAYAIERGFAEPDRILMLAFNADAAAELRERVSSRLRLLGLPHGVRASTFHAFGLSVIGEVMGRKPRIAAWVENGRDVAKVTEIVDDLRDCDPDFRVKWDAFRLLYGRLSEEPDGGEPDSYDRSRRLTGFRTFRGETVRSEGERLIADWLFLNGVNYQYERPYVHDVADSEHAQYQPDFFYPDIQAWHEHWALRADGTPPDSFHGYAEAMRWKKQIHQQYGTTLIETTWHEIIDFKGFVKLASDLQRHGLVLDWDPDRPIPGAQPLDQDRVAGLVRTFMAHVKSSSLSREAWS
ncbi:MAG: UvrD-helicase domain-containing protein [Solirubrobacterales bacterium]